MSSFDRAWKIAKNDVVECDSCGDGMADGDQYNCDECGYEFCEDCMVSDDQYGLVGYRGPIDYEHPMDEEITDRGHGAVCPECASQMARERGLLL